jgi:CDP-6-deoxy-D-xylo-4-hexulose-3-dehydrase
MQNRILYAKAVFGDNEKKAVLESLNNSWLAAGVTVEKFEKAIAKLFGKKYALATNSGSSANLLAISSLNLPKGSEVITPACTFATTVAPIIQCGLVPVFVDSVIGRYTIDEEKVEEAITSKTKALMIPQLIGGVANMEKLREIADRHNLYLIDDCCDTLAPYYKNKQLARFSDLTTTSFYGSHIITTMGTGGIVLTDSKELITRLRSLTNWGRVGTDNEDFDERFNYDIDNIPYDAKFIYSNIGYNLKMTEGQAAFGLQQLKRLDGFIAKRFHAHNYLDKFFKDWEKYFYLPHLLDNSGSIWLAYALTIKEDAPFDRYELLRHLDNNGIQVRVLFSGNITRHPAYRSYLQAFDNADTIMQNGFLIGCHQGLSPDDLEYIVQTFREFLAKYE